jgi:hypothetical protein
VPLGDIQVKRIFEKETRKTQILEKINNLTKFFEKILGF